VKPRMGIRSAMGNGAATVPMWLLPEFHRGITLM
jgi:hypothetical protein